MTATLVEQPPGAVQAEFRVGLPVHAHVARDVGGVVGPEVQQPHDEALPRQQLPGDRAQPGAEGRA
ncbi:hypothetical protein K7G98_36350, partial [Saccharothrix sp. MB29]|nr:hypothetical protein [Saccharothrix sp. MB29]